jgi:RNA polymerase sigma-70 factor (family 1)
VGRYKLLHEQYFLLKLKAGDRDVFSEIFSAYYRDLVMFAYSFIKEIDNSEEIVQDVFVKLWEDHENITITVSLKSYLLKSVQNRCIDWHRHNKIKTNHSDYIINSTPLFEYDTDNYVLRSELEGLIEKAIAALPEKFREAFELNRVEGLTYKEIAEKLKVSVRTVEVRISKALEILRTELIDFL